MDDTTSTTVSTAPLTDNVTVENAQSVQSDDDFSGVQWEDSNNVRSTRVKTLDDDGDGDDDEDDYNPRWHIPENAEGIDIEVLASLPVNMRKGVIEEARRNERAKKRSTYIPVASNPSLYSQTQLSNFLRTR